MTSEQDKDDSSNCCQSLGASSAAKLGYLTFTSLMVAGLILVGVGWLAVVEYKFNPNLPARENEQRAHEAFFLRQNYDACIVAGLITIVIGLMANFALLLIELFIRAHSRDKSPEEDSETTPIVKDSFANGDSL